MLIRFRVQNHRSIRDEQTLSMVATEPFDDPRLLSTPAIPEKLLPAVALYGANASGKSNVLHALEFMRTAVDHSHRSWEPQGGIPRDPFVLSAAGEGSSTYEVEFVIDDVRHAYGFVMSSERVIEEWLTAWPAGNEQTLFERDGDTFTFGKALEGPNPLIQALTRPNSLFLSCGAQNNHTKAAEIAAWFTHGWFSRARPSGPVVFPFAKYLEHGDTKVLGHFMAMLRHSDVGIVGLRFVPGAGLELQHESSDADRAWLPASQESAGTIAMMGLALPIVFAASVGGILSVDELEASLHPSLATHVIRLFSAPTFNQKGAQLVFTTHDTNLLGQMNDGQRLRRDQIWFTEKDREGATHLYPLTDFEPQPNENLERGYMQGRYGAVPFLGDFVAALRAEGEKK